MHVPDGFLDATTSLATSAVAATAVGFALQRAQHELHERTAPLAGMTAAYVFAVQMVNFPVGIGTSGHLMGGALAAVLVGPWTAVLCMSVVLLVQALLFADGGLTAIGTNVSLIAVVTVAVGWVVTRLALAALPHRPASVVPAAAAGALLSVPAAAAVFVVLFAVGGQASLPVGALLASMVGWHTLVGIGEALITGFTVSAVVAVRPDLVYAARDLRPSLQLRRVDGSLVEVPAPATHAARRGRVLLVMAAVAVLAVAGGLSYIASTKPDGLEYVARTLGFVQTAGEQVFGGLPLADYGAVGGVPVGVAGVLGVLVTVLLGFLVFRAVGRRAERHRSRAASR